MQTSTILSVPSDDLNEMPSCYLQSQKPNFSRRKTKKRPENPYRMQPSDYCSNTYMPQVGMSWVATKLDLS